MHGRTLLLVGCLVLAGISGAAGLGVVGASGSVDGERGGPAATTLADGDVTAAASAVALQPDCSFPTSVTDVTGTEVTVDQRPERIVALQPSGAQILWEIGVQNRVVGMDKSRYTAYLAGRDGKTNVKNDDLTVNAEQVIGLQPDLVLAANVTSVETVRQLRAAGITVYHFGTVRSLNEIAENIETVGRLTGNCERARSVATEFRLSVARARNASERAGARPDVLYYFFDTTTGTGTHIHDVIESAGGNNVAADAGIQGYASLNTEVVVERDPDWIVYPDGATLPNSAAFNGTTAVREGQTIALNSNYISQPGPRVAIPLTRLAKTWHPEALDRANRTINRSDVRTNASTTAPGTTATTGPGFTGPGVGVAVALLIGALSRRRD